MKPEPFARITKHWQKEGLTIGRLLENAAMLAGVKLSLMTDDEVADAVDDYVKWRVYMFGGTKARANQ